MPAAGAVRSTHTRLGHQRHRGREKGASGTRPACSPIHRPILLARGPGPTCWMTHQFLKHLWARAGKYGTGNSPTVLRASS